MKKRTFLAAAAALLAALMLLSSCDEYNYDLNEYITLGQYNGVSVAQADIDTELENAINSIIEENTVWTEVDRAAKNGDTVNIDYVGTIDDVAFDGGTAANQDLELGSGRYIDGFESGLVGHKAGETVTLNLTFPENFGVDTLNGQDCVFTVTVNKVSEAAAPEFDDALAASATDYATVAEYKAETSRIILENMAWEKVTETTAVKTYPEKEVKNYYNSYIENYTNYASMYGTSLENIASALLGFSDMQTFTAYLVEMSKNYVKNDMIALLIAKNEGIEVSSDDYQRIGLELAHSTDLETVKELEEAAGKDSVKNNVLIQLVIDFIADHAVIA